MFHHHKSFNTSSMKHKSRLNPRLPLLCSCTHSFDDTIPLIRSQNASQYPRIPSARPPPQSVSPIHPFRIIKIHLVMFLSSRFRYFSILSEIATEVALCVCLASTHKLPRQHHEEGQMRLCHPFILIFRIQKIQKRPMTSPRRPRYALPARSHVVLPWTLALQHTFACSSQTSASASTPSLDAQSHLHLSHQEQWGND